MRKTGAHISFALLFVVATLLTQRESEVGIRAARVSKRPIRAATPARSREPGRAARERPIRTARARPERSRGVSKRGSP